MEEKRGGINEKTKGERKKRKKKKSGAESIRVSSVQLQPRSSSDQQLKARASPQLRTDIRLNNKKEEKEFLRFDAPIFWCGKNSIT